MLMHLKSVIELSFPDADLLFKWHIPFFYIGKRPFCYLNQTKNYVDVAFFHRGKVEDYNDLLISEKRKVVKSLRYHSLDAIDETVLIEVLEKVKP